MRKVTKEYEVYKFNELEKDVQEEVLKRYTKSEHDFYIDNELYDDMVELAKDSLQNYFKGAKYNNIYYDLSYAQGSGAMIEFNIDLKDLNNKYKMLTDEEVKKCSDIGYTNIKVYHNDSHYYHERTFDIDWNDFIMYSYTSEYCENIEKVQKNIDAMIELFREDIVLMNKQITQDGYKMLEDNAHFEEMAMERVNELEFLSDGREFNEYN